MAAGSVSQTIASQFEHVDDTLEPLYLMSAPLWKRFKKDQKIKAVSNRPSRTTFEAISGGKFRASGLDGQDMGRGSSVTEVFGDISCVTFIQASEYTKLADYATDSNEKAIKDYVTLTQQRAAESFGQYLDAVVCYGDGANTLDTVVSTTTGGIVVNNANKFQGNQDVDVWPSPLGSGAKRGTITIQTPDIANNTIWLTTAIPVGTVAGDLLLVSGSAGVANTGLYGLQYFHSAGNTGNYEGIQKSAFPGEFSTPNINLNSASMTPQSVRALDAQVRLAIGSDKADQNELFCHGGVEGQAAWENTSLNVQHVVANEVKGDQAFDMLKRKAPTLIAGREYVPNERATPGRLDFISQKMWSRVETTPFGFYEVGGQTVFPTYGISGGIASSIIFYYKVMLQLHLVAPRADAYLSNFAIPRYYFGH